MKVLLDTHIFLWAVLEPERLPTRLRTLIESPETELIISTASAWEIATKHRLGKLHGATEIIKRYPMVIATLGATELPVLSAHALKAGGWDSPHRDPFDRMLAAQSHIENLPLLSVDKAMQTFGISLIAE
ncbi:MAG: type II toxin-antitoxin system VapC family toxin [Pseudomonadota bacterium]